MLPFDVEYTAYDTTHVLAQTQLLFFSALAFVWLNLQGYYPPELPSTNLDAEWIYRKPLPRLAYATLDRVFEWQGRARVWALAIIGKIISGLSSYHQDDGVFARTWHTGRVAFWVIFVLAMYLTAGLL